MSDTKHSRDGSASAKKAYEAPKFEVLGTMEALTLGNIGSTKEDSLGSKA